MENYLFSRFDRENNHQSDQKLGHHQQGITGLKPELVVFKAEAHGGIIK